MPVVDHEDAEPAVEPDGHKLPRRVVHVHSADDHALLVGPDSFAIHDEQTVADAREVLQRLRETR